MKDQPQGKLHPIESKYMAGAAVVGFLLTLLLTGGSLIAAFGPPAYFATLATLSGALAIYDLWRKARRRPVPPSQKSPFIRAQPRA